jgi:hypothetical protein
MSAEEKAIAAKANTLIHLLRDGFGDPGIDQVFGFTGSAGKGVCAHRRLVQWVHVQKHANLTDVVRGA